MSGELENSTKSNRTRKYPKKKLCPAVTFSDLEVFEPKIDAGTTRCPEILKKKKKKKGKAALFDPRVIYYYEYFVQVHFKPLMRDSFGTNTAEKESDIIFLSNPKKKKMVHSAVI